MDYSQLLDGCKWSTYAVARADLSRRLPDLWIDEYCASCTHEPNVLQITIEGFEHLFDFTSGAEISGPHNAQVPEDRLVAVFGLSEQPEGPRDSSRMKGFLGPGLVGQDGRPRDKGHFIAHSAGGGLDINLFRQRPELNRGRSAQGKIFRRMEAYAAGRPGTFVFARPIYSGLSWTPSELEYGILLHELRLWVERFAN